jgi:hypothetical protein
MEGISDDDRPLQITSKYKSGQVTDNTMSGVDDARQVDSGRRGKRTGVEDGEAIGRPTI